MPVAADAPSLTADRTHADAWPRRSIAPVCTWLLGFAPVTYLALSGGGYDIVARSQFGIAAWWIVLVGAVAGVLPRGRPAAAGWFALALLAGYFAWTWLATGWSQSSELTLDEAARVSSYLGLLAIGLCVIDRKALFPLLSGLAAAIGLVSALAVLSRLEPSWFPTDTTASVYATSRLSYPFDYSDGVGEFAALGLPLLLYIATGARSLLVRALGAAGLPAVVLCLAMTVSRGGILAAVVGLIVFFALVPDRLPRLATALIALAGSAAAMVTLLDHRAVLDQYTYSPAPATQRHAVLLVFVLVCAGVGCAQAGITVIGRRAQRPAWLAVSRRSAAVFAGALVALGAVALVVVIATGADHRLWQEFKQPNPPAAGTSYLRLLSISGSHRYQYWQSALAAFHTSPWQGIGPGTFRLWWTAHNSLHEYVLNAHSLYIETLAELGIIGLTLIGGFVVFVLAAGATRAVRAPEPTRLPIATAVASFASFCAAAAFDWVWQIGVIPFVAMLLAGAALARVDDSGTGGRRARPWPAGRVAIGALAPIASRVVAIAAGRRALIASRVVAAAGALVAIWAIAVPLADTAQLRASEAASARGDLRTALADAATAVRLEPSAASPRLQEALVFERLAAIGEASRAIAQAIERERTNSSLWLIASRIATEADRPAVALSDYRRARSLDPTSPIFAR